MIRQIRGVKALPTHPALYAVSVRARASACVRVCITSPVQIERLLLDDQRVDLQISELNGKYKRNWCVPQTLTQTQSIYLAFFKVCLSHACINDQICSSDSAKVLTFIKSVEFRELSPTDPLRLDQAIRN